MDGLLAILDIGKSNARLLVMDPASDRPLHVARRPNHNTGGPVRQLDVAGLGEWLLQSLRDCPQRARIRTIVPVAHGAACVMLDATGAVVLAPDYEDPVFEGESGAYRQARDAFAESFSPDLPLGLNLGRQIFFVQHRLPEQFARVSRILLYPQYWAWLLSGVAASEVTSLGCHTDLWSPRHGRFSPLVGRQGWDALFPPLRPAADVLGPVTPALAEACGLDPSCQVLCGIHDSNASWLRHRTHRPPDEPFSVISSGTWTVILANRADLSALRAERDMLANVDAFGAVVGTARFMGGREYEAVAGAGGATPSRSDLARVLESPALVRPSFAAGGPFPNGKGEISGADALDPPARAALATLYVALLSDTALDLLGASGDIVIDGPLSENPLYPLILASLRPASRVQLGESGAGPAGGALCLALGSESRPPVLRTVPTEGVIPGLPEHARRWRDEVGV